ncbi:30S ribosomal protein S4 [Patescibacteria group bacterium]|nr:30S ribosomal protein S4 [Patescibacteria group bacterium]MBU1034625.1 30S ribosomal protein S4 [Patescibacteria group bacterium]MBU1630038.1 30S ribosomal protein S4 [Patescibacteria group bacterium]MBU1908241.1 30S ribosomal protein S4 [Patescibacteria group bacterium]
MRTLKLTCKHCRREGVSLCGRAKCAFNRRPYAPGVHGPKGKGGRMTDYAKQLREKQKAKRLYGVSEKQFSNYFKKAVSMKGDSGENLVRLLEMRLDNSVFRSGFAKTRAAARQVVSHSHVFVNGKKTDIASFQVKPGDVLRIRDNKREKGLWKNLLEDLKKQETPSWLALNPEEMEAKVTSRPDAEELKQVVFDPKLIIEFYSR